jgi:hypothetical protein
MTDQVDGLFGPQPGPAHVSKTGRRNTIPKGYAGMPGTGPSGKRCKHCEHCVAVELAKRYWKCALNRGRWTHGRGSDIKINSPACSRFLEAKELLDAVEEDQPGAFSSLDESFTAGARKAGET